MSVRVKVIHHHRYQSSTSVVEILKLDKFCPDLVAQHYTGGDCLTMNEYAGGDDVYKDSSTYIYGGEEIDVIIILLDTI